MNAVPPKGQMASKGAQAPDDHIHLTMSFEDEPEIAQAVDSPAEMGAPEDGLGAVDGPSRQRQGAAASRTSAGREARTGLLPQFAGIELSLTVEVGSLNIPLKDLMAVEPGQLLALDRMTSEPVSVLVNGKPFARGEIVAVGDRYGVRLLEIVAPAGGAI
jgi:flagellar motor switch protein FliN/FliY